MRSVSSAPDHHYLPGLPGGQHVAERDGLPVAASPSTPPFRKAAAIVRLVRQVAPAGGGSDGSWTSSTALTPPFGEAVL